MSHFTIAVFTEAGQDIDDLMEPFNENMAVEQYVVMTKDQLVKERRQQMQSELDQQYAEWQKAPQVYEKGKPPEHIAYLKSLPALMKRTDEEIHQELVRERYEEDEMDEDGNLISIYNPQSKWDWFEVDGRWKDMLMRKPANNRKHGNLGLADHTRERCDSADTADIDFHAMRAHEIRTLPPYEQVLNNSFYKEETMRKQYPTQLEYIQRYSTFSTYAVLTPDGEWYESGEMNWLELCSETVKEKRDWEDSYYECFIKPAITNGWQMTIVDCHI